MPYATRQLGPGCVKPGDTCYLPFRGRRVPATVMSVDSVGMVYWPRKEEAISGEPIPRAQKPGYLGFNDIPLPLAVRTREGKLVRLVRADSKDRLAGFVANS